MEVGGWLRSLGLAQYEATFREHDIDAEVLPELTEGDLEGLGISLGHRKRLLKAIRRLQTEAPVEKPTAPPVTVPALDSSQLAERRQLTVMFCDLAGSTALSTRLDPEDLREVVARYQACVTGTVNRFDGFVAKYMGDGVLAYFGYPRAHEDDAEQAVRAGLALIDAVGALEGPQRLQVRIGIATGLVVVGDLIGSGSAQEQAIVGETPNLAARLQTLAEPGAIVIAESTRRQIGRLFDVIDFGPQSLKGFAEPQRAWRVGAENRALGRFEALRSGETPLIGRDEELELLLRRWGQAKASSGRVVLISGEPGVGKSRLGEALVEQTAGEPHLRLRYFCSSHHQDSALYPVITQMERAARFAHEDSARERLGKLQAVLAATEPPIEDIALIADLHSLPSADLAPPLDVTPQRKKEKTFEALLRQVGGLCRQQPVLMVFEDIHWIDPSSRELLDRTIECIAKWPVLLVATFRPEFQPPWIGQPHVAVLTLTRLDRRDTAAMVANIAGDVALSADIVQEIAERTDGVPLFVEELTNAVLESGAQTALSSVPHAALAVLATLHASLMARLDRLGPAAKNVAQMGAAIGREFGHELLAFVVELPELQLREALDRLSHAGLLFVRGTPPHASYIFKHALVQDAAYGTLLRGRRQGLHRRIGTTLEAQFPETVDAQPGLLAHHFTEAGEANRAVDYWLKAGKQALAGSAMVEAEALVRKGLTVVASLPDGLSRQKHELDLHIALGHALFATQGYGDQKAGDAFSSARRICERLGFGPKMPAILYGQWLHHAIRGDLNHAAQLATEMRQFGELHGDVVTRVMSYRTSGATHLWLGEFEPARAYLEHGLALYNPAERLVFAEMAPQDTFVVQLCYLSIALVSSGYLDQSQRRGEVALREARRLAHAYTLAFAIAQTFHASWLARSEPKALLQQADELSVLTAESGIGFFRDVALVQRGWCHVVLGHVDQGILMLTTGLTDARASGDVLDMPSKLNMLADAYRIAGQPQTGLVHLAEAESVAEGTDMREHEAFSLRLRGDLLIQTGDFITAEASLREAIAVAGRQGAKLHELTAATSLARLWRDQGKTAVALALLTPIYDWFTEGFDAPDLVEAKALLDELDEGARRKTVEGTTAVSDSPAPNSEGGDA